MANIEVDEHIWSGIEHYLKALHKEGAVDDVKMKFAAAYYPLEHLLKLWGIEPYKVQHNLESPGPGQTEKAR